MNKNGLLVCAFLQKTNPPVCLECLAAVKCIILLHTFKLEDLLCRMSAQRSLSWVLGGAFLAIFDLLDCFLLQACVHPFIHTLVTETTLQFSPSIHINTLRAQVQFNRDLTVF